MLIEIVYLKDQPEHLPLLAEWAFNTWGHYNPGSSLEWVQQKLIEHSNTDSLPITVIALNDNKPVGMCSLRASDGILPELTPWLASLYVEPAHRSQGVGEKLINFIKQKAKLMGHPKLYLLAFEHTLRNWYETLGWQLIGVEPLNDRSVIVMEQRL